ncbi:MAG: hypothetical protein WBX00_11660 [Isosphaeraceae bacterium]
MLNLERMGGFCRVHDPAGTRFNGVVRIEADVERCRQHIEKSLAVCTALAPRIGYDTASAIAKTAYYENRTVREIASELVGLDPDRVAARLGQPDSAAALREKGGLPLDRRSGTAA